MRAARRVLFVDDDQDLRELVAAFLRSEGHDVATAAEGREALDLVARAMPDVILLDMRMPVMDGREFAARFHERHGPAAPIVVITASEDARARAEEIGAAAWLSKPFELDALLAAVITATEPAAPGRATRAARAG